MHLLWRRYARTGHAPGWFYIAAPAAFAGVVMWAVADQDWLVATIAATMVVVAFFGGRLMRRLSEALAESSRRVRAEIDESQSRGGTGDDAGVRDA